MKSFCAPLFSGPSGKATPQSEQLMVREEGTAAWGLQNSDKEAVVGSLYLPAASLHSVPCVRKFKLTKSEPIIDKSGFSLRADRQATSWCWRVCCTLSHPSLGVVQGAGAVPAVASERTREGVSHTWWLHPASCLDVSPQIEHGPPRPTIAGWFPWQKHTH